ncbi:MULTISPECIES: DUF4919 domain-containing protein [Rufibacter]|uniref:DUF4919 domain-containing protein n=1 Tax=Rufibacter quisquiliarum TaxID=1549639 RepID=A0A839GVE7_9BACT|nr:MULTISPECIES: DUF4919 domain-containing protein [Rufibacter]MBA9078837.1 hypothetical protein [Rufibacter quisquiliarum]
MKRLFLLTALCLSVFVNGHAQTISKINFDAIKTAISSSKSKLYYPNLLKRYHANDGTLTPEEYKHLYYGWVMQPGYSPYKGNDKADALNEMLLYEKFPEIVSTGKKILATDPFNMDVMYLIHMAYGEMNNQAESKKWLVKFDGLMQAIKASGNGRSPETAVVLAAPRDEYMFLTVVGLRQNGPVQTIDNKYHLINIKSPNKLNLTQVYFNIQKPLAKKK